MDPSSVRNLERIQEKDDVSRMPRAVSITLLVLGGACIVLSAMALGGKKSGEAAPKNDPLGDLVQKKPVAAVAKTADLQATDVTFPSILSDNAKPTTALAAVNAKPETNAAPDATAAADGRDPGHAVAGAERPRGVAGRDAPARRSHEGRERSSAAGGDSSRARGARRQLPAPGELVQDARRGRQVRARAPRSRSQIVRHPGERSVARHVVSRPRRAISDASGRLGVSLDLRGERARRAFRRTAELAAALVNTS